MSLLSVSIGTRSAYVIPKVGTGVEHFGHERVRMCTSLRVDRRVSRLETRSVGQELMIDSRTTDKGVPEPLRCSAQRFPRPGPDRVSRARACDLAHETFSFAERGGLLALPSLRLATDSRPLQCRPQGRLRCVSIVGTYDDIARAQKGGPTRRGMSLLERDRSVRRIFG